MVEAFAIALAIHHRWRNWLMHVPRRSRVPGRIAVLVPGHRMRLCILPRLIGILLPRLLPGSLTRALFSIRGMPAWPLLFLCSSRLPLLCIGRGWANFPRLPAQVAEPCVRWPHLPAGPTKPPLLCVRSHCCLQSSQESPVLGMMQS